MHNTRPTMHNYASTAISEDLKEVYTFISSIYWIKNNGELCNGTIFYINTGKDFFAITAYHVIKEFLQFKEQNKAAECRINNFLFENIEERLVDHDEELDIAVLKLSENEIKSLAIGKMAIDVTQQYFQEVKGMKSYLCGFPGTKSCSLYIDTKTRNNYFAALGMGLIITTVSETNFKCQVVGLETNFGPISGLSNFDYGGMSGAPVLIKEKGLWKLVGILIEGPDTKENQIQGFEVLIIRKAKFILPNGELHNDLSWL